MLITTISSYFDDKIEKVLGLVSVQVRHSTRDSEFLRTEAISRLKTRASELSNEEVDAIIGVQFNVYCAPEMPNTTYLIATGTSVTIKDEFKHLCIQ